MAENVLYGVPFSLYTGRARSYLIKAGIPFREQPPLTPHFMEHVRPKAGGRVSMPTLELADGTVIRDGVAIVDHFEAVSGGAFAPETPKQRVVSLLFDVIGAEGLLRPAMHYRWNFPEENGAFLALHFENTMPPGPDRRQRAETNADRMRGAAVAFGVTPEHYRLIETLYEELLARLDAHFSAHPYLLGGRPCIGDFGMMAPLYAHLGRDPKPLGLMQTRSPMLFRWTERMNRADADAFEFRELREEYLDGDVIPDTLADVLRLIAEDFVPETKAAREHIDAWLADQPALAPGTPTERGLGLAPVEIRGEKLHALAQTFRFYLLQRVQDAYEGLADAERRDVAELLGACGLEDVLTMKLMRRIGRENNLEVWL